MRFEAESRANLAASDNPGNRRVVRGEIALEEGSLALGDAVIYVRLEEVTEADAPARVVAEERLTGFDACLGAGRIPFRLTVGEVDARASYSVAVLVDLDGDGRAGPGDFRSMQSYPVLTHSFPGEVCVKVRRVG